MNLARRLWNGIEIEFDCKLQRWVDFITREPLPLDKAPPKLKPRKYV